MLLVLSCDRYKSLLQKLTPSGESKNPHNNYAQSGNLVALALIFLLQEGGSFFMGSGSAIPALS